MHTLGDAHLYANHLDLVRQQLEREPRTLPTVRLNPDVKDIFGFTFDDVTFQGYDPHPAIRAKISV